MRVPLLALLGVFAAACAQPGGLARPPGLTLPDGDRVVRVQPGDCDGANCIIADRRYESVTTIEGRERSDEQLGRELATSLARSGWTEAQPLNMQYGSGQISYPYRFIRSEGGRPSYLELFPAFPGTYGLAYDEDGDSVSGG